MSHQGGRCACQGQVSWDQSLSAMANTTLRSIIRPDLNEAIVFGDMWPGPSGHTEREGGGRCKCRGSWPALSNRLSAKVELSYSYS